MPSLIFFIVVDVFFMMMFIILNVQIDDDINQNSSLFDYFLFVFRNSIGDINSIYYDKKWSDKQTDGNGQEYNSIT